MEITIRFGKEGRKEGTGWTQKEEKGTQAGRGVKKRGWIPPVSRLGSGLIFTVDRSVDGSGITPPLLFIGDRARFVVASRERERESCL